jgi:hypothetical protein
VEYDLYAAVFKDGKVSEPVKFSTRRGRFVASNSHKPVAYSDDGGNTWIQAATHPDAGLNVLAYGNGVLVGISKGSPSVKGKAAWSADGGKNWTTVNNALEAAWWMDVAYGDGKFVAVYQLSSLAYSTPSIAYSTDGKTWKTQAGLPTTSFEQVAYGNGRFVAVPDGDDGWKAGWSVNGTTWNAAAIPDAGRLGWNTMAYGDGRFVAFSNYTDTYVVYSDDGQTWTRKNRGIAAATWDIAYGNGRFVAVTRGRGDWAGAAVSDDRGETWTGKQVSDYSTYSCLDLVAYGGGRFVAIDDGSGGNAVWSEDGESWTISSGKLPSINWPTDGWLDIIYIEP